MIRQERVLSIAALAILLLASSLVASCGGAEKPSAQIKAWEEPTQTLTTDTAPSPVATDVAPVPGQADKKTLEKRVKVASVSYSGDQGFLVVNFVAPPRLAMLWQPSDFRIVDEATGVEYHNVPLMPKIGFLIGRPAVEGQYGYVMLENRPWLKPGSRVTVQLGGVVKKHLVTQTSQETTPTPP